MHVDITVRTRSGDQDVRLHAPAGTTTAELAAAAWRATGAPAERALPDAVVLRDGALLPSAARPSPGSADPLLLEVIAGRCAGTTVPVKPGRLLIGRAAECNLRLDDPRVSRRHAELRADSRGVTLCDLGATNGVLVDGEPLGTAAAPLQPGAIVRLGDSQLLLRRRDAARASVTVDGPYLVVSPGGLGPRAAAPGVIDVPVRKRRSARRVAATIVAALVPAVAGIVLALVTRSTSFLLFALLSPVTMLTGAIGSGAVSQVSHREHRRAVQRAATSIANGLREETAGRRAEAPDAVELEHVARLPGAALWRRDVAAPDFLHLRLGTAAQPSRLEVRRGGDVGPAGLVRSAPVVADLRAGPLGIVGPSGPARALGRFLLAQAAVLHRPASLRVGLLAAPGSGWEWARWLPHLDGRVGLTSAQGAALATRIAADAATSSCATLLLVDRHADRQDVGWLGDAARAAPDAKVICLAPDVATLPVTCHRVVRLHDADGSVATLDGGDGPEPFVLDLVDDPWADRVARSLAPMRERAELPATAADLLRLLDCDLSTDAVVKRWAYGRASLATPIGVGSRGPVILDLAADGPHALIAGTTGSGKSALLRSLVLGLALTHSPAEVGFLLIDYKGGAAFAACADLPHTTGLVTDLDARLTRRALRSLDAEIRRRERLLAGAGAADYAAYRSARNAPALTRLVVVVDEFATLADDLPGFVPGLVDIAQRGRSLGMHLVLATQRPGRAVTPDIRANTSVRIALRVTDPAESRDVVGVPDAAAVPATRPGQGVMRVAGSDPVAFRAALPRTDDGGVRAEVLGPWRTPATHQARSDPLDDADTAVTRIARILRDAARAHGVTRPAPPWLPPLPVDLPADLPPAGPPESSTITVGAVDLPDQQCRQPLQVDLDAGAAHAICGAHRSGRTAALLTAAVLAAAQRSPRDLQVHAVDCDGALGGGLRRLPHLATALSAADPALVVRLLRRLRTPGGSRRLLLLDDWDALCADAGDAGAADLHAALADLVRAGPAMRLTAVVSLARPPAPARRGVAFDETLLLRPVDRADAATAGIAPGELPADLPPGRGIRAGDGAEFQLVRLDSGSIEEVTRRWADTPLGEALRFRPLPSCVALAGCGPAGPSLRLGVGGDEAAPVAVDADGGPLLVAGDARSGRSTALLVLLQEAGRLGLPALVAAPPRSPLRLRAERGRLPLLTPDGAPDDVAACHGGGPAVLLVDDCECFEGTAVGERLAEWLQRAPAGLLAVVAGRAETMTTSFRGVAAVARRNRRGLLLQPAPLDGELLGVRLDRAAPRDRRPGRGVAVGLRIGDGAPAEAVALQVARPDPPAGQCPDMWGYR